MEKGRKFLLEIYAGFVDLAEDLSQGNRVRLCRRVYQLVPLH